MSATAAAAAVSAAQVLPGPERVRRRDDLASEIEIRKL